MCSAHAVRCAIACLLLVGNPASAAVLPDDRADALYHSYEGGGVEITGPSVMVLKKFGQSVAVTGNYYVDSVSSASIDVITSGASPYDEDRTEYTGAIEYLHGNSVMSLSYTNSDEDDYEGNTASFGISMDMFGNMTTVNMGYSYGWDTVRQNDNPGFSEDIDRHTYRVGVSQVLTKDMILELDFEGITDEGFLNNPYRVVRYLNPDGISTSNQPEVYPNTRDSAAATLRAKYYLPWRAAALGEYRYFTDTWEIDAHTVKAGYTHPLPGGWKIEGSYRYYTQDAAEFYSDLFPFQDAQNFLARDKELSTFTSHTLGVKVSYEFIRDGWRAIDRASLNFAYDYIWFDYDDFRDARETGVTPGTESLYDFTADVLQVYLSVWF